FKSQKCWHTFVIWYKTYMTRVMGQNTSLRNYLTRLYRKPLYSGFHFAYGKMKTQKPYWD
ncbi:MAG: hypothetical protein ACKPCM_06840, partial [Pseudanabaena sp.]